MLITLKCTRVTYGTWNCNCEKRLWHPFLQRITKVPKVISVNYVIQSLSEPNLCTVHGIATNFPKIADVNGRLALCRQNYNLHNVLFLLEDNIVKHTVIFGYWKYSKTSKKTTFTSFIIQTKARRFFSFCIVRSYNQEKNNGYAIRIFCPRTDSRDQ